MDKLSAAQIIERLEPPSLKGLNWIEKNARIVDMIRALQQAEDANTRVLISDTLGRRRARSAVRALIACLDDASIDVRCSAAASLGKIADVKAGEALLNHLLTENDLWVKAYLVFALAELNYKPAIPAILHLLDSPHERVRENSAYALAYMMDKSEALDPLKKRLSLEQVERVRESLVECITRLERET